MRHDAHYVDELAASPRFVGRLISINLIEPNPEQPRVDIGDLTELAGSVKEKGVLEPLLVKPKPDGTWMIIAGERRWRAANLAGLSEVPCIEMDLDEKGIAEIALIENLQRRDLSVWEESDGLAFLASRFEYTHDEIAQKIGKSRTTVTECMKIAGLPPSIRARCTEAKITSKSVLLEIGRQFDDDAMHVFMDGLEREGQAKKSKPKNKNSAVLPKDSSEPKFLPGSVNSHALLMQGNIFTYVSPDESFTLGISFRTADTVSAPAVLKSLKSVFQAVKEEMEK
jgi:ParB family transcriptional regulator, chromosome partitioning protein